MVSIVKLPSGISCSIISSFLDLKSVGRLDSSFCNHQERSVFHELLSVCEAVFDSAEFGESVIEICLRWLIVRNIKISVFTFWSRQLNLNADQLRPLFQNSIRCLREVNTRNTNVLRALGNITGSYENIKDFRFNLCNAESLVLSNLLSKLASCLESLYICETISDRKRENRFVDPEVKCLKVKILHLDGNRSMMQFGGFELCFANVEDLSLRGDSCEYFVSCNMFQHYPNLKKLYLDDSNIVTDETMRTLADNCRHLTHFGIENCPRITEAAILLLCQKYTKLQSMEILDLNARLTDISLRAIVDNLSLCLTSLHISDCFLSDQSSLGILSGCKLLQELTFSNLEHCKESDLVACFTKCTSLRSVDVSYIQQLTDKALLSLATSCPELTAVNLAHSTGYSAAGILGLVVNAKNLTQMTFGSDHSDCVWIDIAIALWNEKYPKLCVDFA